jgi:hypothetical protein
MYVEISGRGSGKTTRLVDHASDELIHNINDRNYLIGLVVFNRSSGERIRRLIIEKFVDKIRYMGYHTIVGLSHDARVNNSDVITRLRRKINIQFDMEHPKGKHINKFYVDEFAYIGNELQINLDGYYCTTPNGDQRFSESMVNFCVDNDIDIMSYDMCELMRVHNHDEGERFDEWCTIHRIYPRQHPLGLTVEGERLNNNLIPKGLQRHRF